VKTTRSRTSCSLLALLALSCPAVAEVPAGKTSSTFVAREDLPRAGLAAPVMPAQAKADPVPDKKEIGIGAKPGQDPYEAYIRLEPPGRERLFGTRDTEKELEERMRQERRDSSIGEPIAFPAAPPLSSEPYEPRKFDPAVVLAEPSYVVYRRLYFEEKNSERYGWNIGLLQPGLSSLVFFRDALMFPSNWAAFPCRRFETNAGQCLPGDTVPYSWRPPEVTATGLLAEVGLVALLFASVP